MFVTVSDPVQIGLVASLSRPGGNSTGAVGPKLLELLHEVIPAAKTAAAFVNASNPNAKIVSQNLQDAARALRLELHVLNVTNELEIDSAFASAVRLQVGGLVIVGDAFINTRGEQIAAIALQRKIPAFFQTRAFAIAGGLLSYGGSASDAYRQAGVHTGRILKGEKPADLPVHQSTKVELTINLKTARTLGLAVPASLLARADEAIH